VDTFGTVYADRYAEQLWLTLLAKAKEVTLFDFRLLQLPLTLAHRAPWQDQRTTFEFDQITAPFKKADGSLAEQLTFARAAGATFEQVDQFIGKLGTPVGVKSYKPYHSRGEDFLHNYLGMIGVPIDLFPKFPADAETVLLTESAACDRAIVPKMRSMLEAGGEVVITSGLLGALRGKGIGDIAEIACTDKKVVTDEFHWRGSAVLRAEIAIVLPRLEYVTNDAWEIIGCHANSSPLLLEASYGKGVLRVLAIPDNFADLYRLPVEVLDRIRMVIAGGLAVRLEGPSLVCLFVYDNGTFVVESFLPEPVNVRVVSSRATKLRDLLTNEVIAGPTRQRQLRERGDEYVYQLDIKPHSYRVFGAE
jgi:hypothetical protein